MKIRRLTLVVVIIIVVSSAILGLFALASKAAKDIIDNKKDGIMGLSIEVDHYEIDWFSLSFALRGIKIYPQGQKSKSKLLASADRLALRFSLLDLLYKKLHIHKLTLSSPTISYIQTGAKQSNWDTLKWEKKKESDKKSKEGFKIIIDDVAIEDGIVNYRDNIKGHRLVLRNLDAKASDIVSGQSGLPTRIYINGGIGKTSGRMKVKGKANFFDKGVNFKLNGSITDAPITYFRSFYSASVPFSIKSGTMDIKTNATSVKSAFRSFSNVEIYDLRAAGLDGMLINQLVLARAGTIKANVTVNGNLDDGNFYASSALSKGLADSILADAKKLNPAELPGAVIKGTEKSIKNIGKGISRGIKKITK